MRLLGNPFPFSDLAACLAFLFAADLLIVQTVQPRTAFLLFTMLLMAWRLLSLAPRRD